MNSTVLLSVALLSAALAGCASTAPEGKSLEAKVVDAKPSDRSGTVCQREKPTGSHFPITVCRTLEEIELDKQAANAMRDRMSSAPRSMSAANEVKGR